MEHQQSMPWIQIVRLFSKIRGRTMQEIKDQAENMGIAFHQIHILKVLSENSSLSQQEIADQLGFDKSSITRAIQVLRTKGYLEKKQDPTDKRVKNVFLTSLGRDLIDQVNGIMTDWNYTMIKGFSPHEIDEVIDYLKRIANNIGVETL